MVTLSTDVFPFIDDDGTTVFYTGATRPVIYGQFADDNGAISVVGATVTVTIDPLATSTAGVYGALATVIDAQNGIVSYTLQQPFSLPPTVRQAVFEVQFTADYGNGVKMIARPFPITVIQATGYGV